MSPARPTLDLLAAAALGTLAVTLLTDLVVLAVPAEYLPPWLDRAAAAVDLAGFLLHPWFRQRARRLLGPRAAQRLVALTVTAALAVAASPGSQRPATQAAEARLIGACLHDRDVCSPF